MADLSLCASETCPARRDCRRNEACPQHHPVSELWQSWMSWEPERGEECGGFWPVPQMRERRDALV